MSNSTKASIRPDLERMGQLIRDAADIDAEAQHVIQSAERRIADRRAGQFACPLCGHAQQRTTETEGTSDKQTVRRRHECLKCRCRWTSVARIVRGSIKPAA